MAVGAWPSGLVAWLEELVQLRIAPTLRLRSEGPHILVWVEGAPGELHVRSQPEVFGPGAPPPAMAWWNPHEEGWMEHPHAQLPAPGLPAVPRPLIGFRNSWDVWINYDVFGLFFWALSRLEEVGCAEVDEHGRFPTHCAHAFRNGYLDRPIVDEWILVLRGVAARLWPSVEQVIQRFALKLSHDVDWPSRYAFRSPLGCLRAMAGDLLHRRVISPFQVAAIRKAGRQGVIHASDPYNTFDQLMRVSEANGESAVFYFMAGKSRTEYDGHYEISHPAVRGLIRAIAARGHQVGLHPSYNAYMDSSVVADEFALLQRICREEGVQQGQWGARMHYLRWRAPDTLRVLAEAGLAWDASLGYADRPGFRCGTSFEYSAVDPVGLMKINIKVRPLAVMDVSLCGLDELNGMAVRDSDVVLKYIDLCKIVSGRCEVLIHNSFDRNDLLLETLLV